MAFIVGHPIKRPVDFYGRSEQVERFFEIVAGTQVQSVSLLGLRRAGKTSFLQYVAHPQVVRHYLRDPERYVMIYLDISFCKTPSEFYQRLLVRLQTALGLLDPLDLRQADLAAAASMYDVEAALAQFGERRIILLLDEFDQLRAGEFDQDFLTELRALTSAWDYELACVTASYWDLYRLGNHIGLPPTSPFYNIFYPSPIYLSGLATADCEALVTQPAEAEGHTVTDDDIHAIWQLAGTMPFFIQATAARWFGKTAPSESVFEADLVSMLSPYFEQWWRNFDACEREVLLAVSHGQPVQENQCTAVETYEAINRLVRYGALSQNSEQLGINGGAFKTWLQTRAAHVSANPPSANGDARQIDSEHVRRVLVNHFSLEDLRTLCFDLDIDPDELRGASKGARAAELVNYCRRMQNPDRLIELIRRERGNVI